MCLSYRRVLASRPIKFYSSFLVALGNLRKQQQQQQQQQQALFA